MAAAVAPVETSGCGVGGHGSGAADPSLDGTSGTSVSTRDGVIAVVGPAVAATFSSDPSRSTLTGRAARAICRPRLSQAGYRLRRDPAPQSRITTVPSTILPGVPMTASLVNHRQPQRGNAGGRGEGPARNLPGSHAAPAVAAEPLRMPPPLRLVPQPEGLLQIHTAPFRGSVASVFSQALRSAGLGSRVLVSQFLKGGVDQGVEGRLWLCGRLQWLRPATPLCLDVAAAEFAAAADGPLAAVREVWDFSRDQLLAGELDLLVLDELGLAVKFGYLSANEVTATLEQRPAHLDVILTGPAMPAALMAMADQVTQLRRGC